MTPETEFGLWLNRKRQAWREAFGPMYGAMVAAGSLEPSLEFCRACSDGEGEALVMKRQYTRAD
jgi:hypothetical protein